MLTTSPETTVLDAATVMNEHRVGALVVVDDGRVVAGLGVGGADPALCAVLGAALATTR